MNTLNRNELVAVCGGIDMPEYFRTDTNSDLQWFMEQLARQEDEQSLRYLLGGSTD